MSKGKVKSFNAHKGYGYIQPDDGSQEILVDIVAVEKAGLTGLPAATKLSYQIVVGGDGEPRAENLQISE